MGLSSCGLANQACRAARQADRRIEIARCSWTGDTPIRRTNGLVEPAGGALPFVRLFQPLEQPDSGTNRPVVIMKEFSILAEVSNDACRFGVRRVRGEGTYRFGLREHRTFNIQHPTSNENSGVASPLATAVQDADAAIRDIFAGLCLVGGDGNRFMPKKPGKAR